METTHRTPVLTRSSNELAVLVSLCTTTVGLALAWFLKVPETPLVLATIAASTAVGFHHSAARPEPEAHAPLQLVSH
jgi:hypothetical protein